MLPVALACQDTATIEKMLTETRYLYEDHDRDAGDTLMMAYERGTFTKVTSLLAAACDLALLHQGCPGFKPKYLKIHCAADLCGQ